MTAAVPDPRFRDQLAEIWCDNQESGDPWDMAAESERDLWRQEVDRLLMPAIAAEMDRRAQAAAGQAVQAG